jgi:hypothetical protein
VRRAVYALRRPPAIWQLQRFSRELLRSASHASASRTAVRSSAYGTAGRTPAHTAESSSNRSASPEIGFAHQRACYGALAQSPSLWCQRLLRVESRRAREEESVAPRARAIRLRLSQHRRLERFGYGSPSPAGSSDAANLASNLPSPNDSCTIAALIKSSRNHA